MEAEARTPTRLVLVCKLVQFVPLSGGQYDTIYAPQNGNQSTEGITV